MLEVATAAAREEGEAVECPVGGQWITTVVGDLEWVSGNCLRER